MPAYVTLCKYTQQGLANVKSSPERMKENAAALKQFGGRFIGQWLTLGEYDIVAITEFPDDQTAAAAVLALARGGNITTVTLKAFSEDEFAQIVSKLP